MNKQESIEIIIKNIEDIGAYALGVDTLLAQGILGLRNQVNGLKEQLDEPSREECDYFTAPYNYGVCGYREKCDDKCKSNFDVWNYCPNCGAKIKGGEEQ